MTQIERCKINWMIIKQMWKIRKRAEDFNDYMGINHNYYYEIQKEIEKSDIYLRRSHEATGIPLEILNGKRLLAIRG